MIPPGELSTFAPARVRGLKLLFDPATYGPALFAPARVRGLKLDVIAEISTQAQFAPARVRGLKLAVCIAPPN